MLYAVFAEGELVTLHDNRPDADTAAALVADAGRIATVFQVPAQPVNTVEPRPSNGQER